MLMNAFIKNLSIRQVAAITSLIIISIAVPAGIFLTSQSQTAYSPKATDDTPIIPDDPSPPPDPNATPTPTPTPTPPWVSQVYCQASSSAVLKNGQAPYTIRLSPFSATAGGDDGIVGYQWDFEGDSVWDLDRFEDHSWIDYTYTEAGTYQPKYRVHGHIGYSEPCDHPYLITITPEVSPSPSPSVSPSPALTNVFDINDDGIINITDYTLFITGFINGLLN